MPIKIANKLPARQTLERENIFVMPESRAAAQDIRPLRIILLNLMPKKIETETQILRLLSNSPLQVEVELLQMASHKSKTTSAEHLLNFYKTLNDIRDEKFDGMIVTGAPVENLEFEQVDYWDELCEVFEWSSKHVYSTFHICWAAQAGLYYRYGLKKYQLSEKMFGIFEHRPLDLLHPLMRGIDDVYYVPHSRHIQPIRVITKRICSQRFSQALKCLRASACQSLYVRLCSMRRELSERYSATTTIYRMK